MLQISFNLRVIIVFHLILVITVFCLVPCDPLDIVFVVDSSGSINYAYYGNWAYALQFISDLATLLPTPNIARFGLVIYADNAQNIFFLNTFINQQKSDLIAAIQSAPYLNTATNTADGIRLMMNEQFTAARGARPNARRLGIVMTDGMSNVNHELTIPNAQQAQNMNITMYCIGISQSIDPVEIQMISSPPQLPNVTYWLEPNYARLAALTQSFALNICNQTAYPSPPNTTAAPTSTTTAPTTTSKFLKHNS